MYLQIIYVWYMSEEDLALNNLKWLVCHQTKQNQNIVKTHLSHNLELIIYQQIYLTKRWGPMSCWTSNFSSNENPLTFSIKWISL